MSLPAAPNRTSPASLRKGDQGWPVFALQQGLDELGYDCVGDGDFGNHTQRQVKRFQKTHHLTVDGVAGQVTQARVVVLIDRRTHRRHPDLPAGLLRGFAVSEGGNNLGAVNWNSPGGVDCGVVQVRCWGPPYYRSAMSGAYDPATAMERVAVTFQGRTNQLGLLTYAHGQPREFAMRCAALAWNWPYAATQYAQHGQLPFPSKDATWAVIGGQRVRFPDGTSVNTWRDWAEFYALGGRHGEGRVTRYVTQW